MRMMKYIVRRILQMIPVILAVTIFNFLLINLAPGDPASVLAGEQATQEQLAAIRESYGLNEPVLTRLGKYLLKLVQGDLGHSFSERRPVIDILTERMGATLMLVLPAIIGAIIFGTLLGALAAKREGRALDHIISNGTMIIYCMPAFWLGMIFILLFSSKLGWLPSTGMYSFNAQTMPKWLDVLRHLVMPVMTLFFANLPTYTKLTRSTAVEIAQEDFVTAAHGIGFSERRVFKHHVLRNALLPTVTMAGMSLSSVFAGALMTETVFSWPGLGRLIYDAVASRDYPVIMGGFLMTTILVIVGGLITDIIYLYLDPRIVHK